MNKYIGQVLGMAMKGFILAMLMHSSLLIDDRMAFVRVMMMIFFIGGILVSKLRPGILMLDHMLKGSHKRQHLQRKCKEESKNVEKVKQAFGPRLQFSTT